MITERYYIFPGKCFFFVILFFFLCHKQESRMLLYSFPFPFWCSIRKMCVDLLKAGDLWRLLGTPHTHTVLEQVENCVTSRRTHICSRLIAIRAFVKRSVDWFLNLYPQITKTVVIYQDKTSYLSINYFNELQHCL